MADEPLSGAEMRALLATALRHLPQAERNVLRRRFGIHAPGEMWSHARIAGDLGLTTKQVEYLETNALRRLRGMRDRGVIAAYQLPPENPADRDEPTTGEDADESGAHRPAE